MFFYQAGIRKGEGKQVITATFVRAFGAKIFSRKITARDLRLSNATSIQICVLIFFVQSAI